MRNQSFIFLLLVLFSVSANAQDKLPHQAGELGYKVSESDPLWVFELYNLEADPGLIIEAYNKWRKANPEVKNQHTQYFKRWLRNLSRTTEVYVDGQPDAIATRLADLQPISMDAEARMGTGWIPRGPFDFDIEAESVSYAPGSAHVYTVEQSLSNPNTLYAGTATIGLWKSINKGISWTHLTSSLYANSVRALEIDHSNEDICYFGGRGGVWKTTDGGLSWNETGDVLFQSLYHDVEDIVMIPGTANTLLLSSNMGLYKTTDGGANWIEILSEDIQEIEIHPSNPLIVYAVSLDASKTLFWKSLDGGNSFVPKLTGWPTAVGSEDQRRTEIAVNPAQPDRIVALATGEAAGGSGLYGIYISDDAGENWSFSCCGTGPGGAPTPSNPNIMHWDTDGLTEGGQYYYDLALAVEPTVSGDILTGGINIWRSTDDGASFTNNAHWTLGSAGTKYVHADVHDIRFYGSDLWVASDGGIYYSNDGGLNFEKRMYGITGTDFWGFGAGFADGEVMLGGTYHNGTLLKDGSVYIDDWISMLGGDNYRGFVNFGDERTVYHDGGKLVLPGDRTKVLSSIPFARKPNASYIIGENSDIAFDPRSYRTLYTGNEGSLWKSKDDGSGFEEIHDFGSGTVTTVEVSRTNPDVIYVAYYPGWWDDKSIWKTADAGATWEDITPSSAELSANLWAPLDLTVSSSDENKIWLTRTPQSSSYNNLNGYKVYFSDDGGDTWVNWSTATLDGQYATNIVHQRATNGLVYLGTRTGVYYRDESMSDWVLYNAGLPISTFSVRLIPYYRDGTLRNGTNHSVWEVDFAVPSAVEAQIAVDKMQVSCLRDTVYFVDHSVLSDNSPTWSWSFPGGTPATSSVRSPKVVYAAEGTYSVSLTVTDVSGSSAQTIDDLITVSNECAPETVPGLAMQSAVDGDLATVPSLDLETNEITFSAWIKPEGIQNDYTGIIMHSGIGAGLNFRPSMELGYHWPGGQWFWSSGLIVPANKWSHVALVITPSSATVYLNGVGATHNIALEEVDFGNLLLGSYQGWGGRYYSGSMDEVCVYNRALSQDEIRALRHLTKVPSEDASLMAYYQFNRTDGEITDRAGSRHATLGGNAVRIISTGPFGGGTSDRISVSGPGSYNFPTVEIKLDFASGASTPNGEVVISRVEGQADQLPNPLAAAGDAYWIINNYGTSSSFGAPEKMEVGNYGEITAMETWFPDAYELFTRTDNADGNTWSTSPDENASDAIAGTPGSLTFEPASGIDNSVQFVIQRNASVSTGSEEPIRGLSSGLTIFPSPVSDEVTVSWKSKMKGPALLRVFDLTGKSYLIKDLEGEISLNQLQIDVASFAPGLYKIEVQDALGDLYQGEFVRASDK